MAARKTASASVADESEDSDRRTDGGGVMRTVDGKSEASDEEDCVEKDSRR